MLCELKRRDASRDCTSEATERVAEFDPIGFPTYAGNLCAEHALEVQDEAKASGDGRTVKLLAIK